MEPAFTGALSSATGRGSVKELKVKKHGYPPKGVSLTLTF
jgi:hypothetical protein